jgi:hypothetical protein
VDDSPSQVANKLPQSHSVGGSPPNTYRKPRSSKEHVTPSANVQPFTWLVLADAPAILQSTANEIPAPRPVTTLPDERQGLGQPHRRAVAFPRIPETTAL